MNAATDPACFSSPFTADDLRAQETRCFHRVLDLQAAMRMHWTMADHALARGEVTTFDIESERGERAERELDARKTALLSIRRRLASV